MKLSDLYSSGESFIDRSVTLSGRILATDQVASIEDGDLRVLIHVDKFAKSTFELSELPVACGSLIVLSGLGSVTGHLVRCDILGCLFALTDISEMNIKVGDFPMVNVKYPG